jgi:hypothetical protein
MPAGGCQDSVKLDRVTGQTIAVDGGFTAQ